MCSLLISMIIPHLVNIWLPWWLSSVTKSCPTLCNPMDCSTPGFPVHHQLLELAQTHVHWVSDAIQPSHPLSSSSPPAFNLSQHQGLRVFSNESVLCLRQPKYWSFTFSISPSNEYSGLISFRMDWLDLLEVQGTLKSLLQHHSSKASVLWHSVSWWSNSYIKNHFRKGRYVGRGWAPAEEGMWGRGLEGGVGCDRLRNSYC